jgi:integrase
MKSKPNTSRWTLMRYLLEIYVPDRQLHVDLKDRTAGYYRQHVAMFEQCVGHPVKLCEVTEKTIRDFLQWTLDRGSKRNTAFDRIHTVKQVLRHWRPEDWPKIGNNGLTPHWLAVDCEGSLEKIFQEKFLPQRTKITTEATVKHYGRSFKMFGQCLGKIPKLEDLTDHNVGTFLRWLVNEKKVKAVTANGYAQRLLALWNWAAKVRLVERFPTICSLPEPEVIPRAWSKEQLADLIRACHRAQGTFEGIRAADWWLAFHHVLWDCGERSGAIRALRWDMLDAKTGHLSVPAEIRKGGQKAMVYHLKPSTMERLEAIRLPVRDLIFPMKDRSTFWKKYRRLVESAGLPYTPHKSGPQKMRRTFASYIKAAGGDPTRALRHSTTRVTDDSYLDPAIADPISPNELLFELVD